MTFLPIVERELRVAARKRGTFWLRVVAALVALVIGGSIMLLTLTPFGGRTLMGGPIFTTLTWLSLAGALSAGLFFTSDCLSEEKREGTLGFLFLTDLRGYDVVLGKLLATSLRCAFALLAIFPVLAITLLLGGVEAGQFWRTLLALSHALFFSLSAGLFVSAISHHPQKALAGTLIMLVVFVFGGPLVDSISAWAKVGNWRPTLSLASPGYVFMAAGGWAGTRFWTGLLTSQIVAWLLLGLACWWVPRSWQDSSSPGKTIKDNWTYRFKFGDAIFRAARRGKLIDPNPVLWLACRERWQSFVFWTLSFLTLGVVIVLIVTDLPAMAWMAWSYIGGALTLVFYLGTASQAGRFLVEARRSGLTELLLASPLAVAQIVQGQWRGLRRTFGPPVILFLIVHLGATFIWQRETWGSMAATVGNAQSPQIAMLLATSVLAALVVLANLIALSWFGMWMGLTSKSTNLATLKTMLWVQIVPWFVITFASSLGVGLLMMWAMMPAFTKGATPNPASFMVWYPLITMATNAVLSVGKDIFFARLARRKLYATFRESAALGLTPMRFSAPPVIALKP